MLRRLEPKRVSLEGLALQLTKVDPKLLRPLRTSSTIDKQSRGRSLPAPALLAIRGHRSAHSFATGPLIADPFISPLGLQMTPALSSK